MNSTQQKLLAIVETWQPNELPEYRGFRCGNCQKNINEAWHHLVDTAGYKLQVHLCKTCENLFRSQTNSNLSKTEFKAFTCDACSKTLDIDKVDKQRKGYHVWLKTNGILAEQHFHKSCFVNNNL